MKITPEVSSFHIQQCVKRVKEIRTIGRMLSQKRGIND